MEKLTNKQQFDKEMGYAFRVFRTKILHKTLKEIGGQSLISSLSNFETGKLFRYDYMHYYIAACQDEEQLQELYLMVRKVLISAWKRGYSYDQKN